LTRFVERSGRIVEAFDRNIDPFVPNVDPFVPNVDRFARVVDAFRGRVRLTWLNSVWDKVRRVRDLQLHLLLSPLGSSPEGGASCEQFVII
jgi:hypothetical protein